MRGPETPDKVRASARKPAEREEHYREWRERHVEAEPWTRDEQEHRSLFFRRYQRPAPPRGLGTPPRVGAYRRSDMTNANSITEETQAA